MHNNQAHTYQVSELTRQVRQLLEASYPEIWVEGEISNIARPASGHLYFSLKDEKSQIRCAFFKNRFNRPDCDPKDGLKVRVKARVSLYENRGDFQLIVSQLEEAGLGNLQLAFEKLKQKLNKEGLFSAEHKKSTPRFPKTIGVITSQSGAVIKDIISTCERRYPVVKLVLYPVQVQGQQAASMMSRSLALADKRKHDVIIIGRGGGSLEDLWAFNEEILARAIFNCQTPIISAVGHDIDYTISDFVADVRAPTPTAAAELATPDMTELVEQLRRTESRITGWMKNIIHGRMQQTDLLTRRLVHPSERVRNWQQHNQQLRQRLKIMMANELGQHSVNISNLAHRITLNSPKTKLAQCAQNINSLNTQLEKLITGRINNADLKINAIKGKLMAISPQSTLQRGYAIVTTQPDKKILRSVKQINSPTNIDVQLADGHISATSTQEN